ncbi:MAG: PAS domain S-box protein [Methanoregulaceae archaeon]|nr:PAS domain S-box protein [Methanoregulaceae archaeon]
MNFQLPRTISIILIILILVITSLAVYTISLETQKALKGAVQDKLITVATITSSQIDADEFAQIREGEENTPRFIRIRDQLQQSIKSSSNIRYIYTLRKTGDRIIFVVDGDYGYDQKAARIGTVYLEPDPEMIQGFSSPTATTDFTRDNWGVVLSGYAPIRDDKGRVVGIVGVDMDSSVAIALINQANLVIFIIGIIAMLAALFGILAIENRRAIFDKKLEESEKKYRDLVEMLPQTIFELDNDGKIISANRIALETFGFTREEFQGGVNGMEMLAPKDRMRAAGNIQKMVMGEKIGGIEYTAQRNDGSTFPAIIYADPIKCDNTPCGIRGVLIDITERKQTEEELERRVRERTKELADTVMQLEAEVLHRKEAEESLNLAHQELQSLYEQLKANDEVLKDNFTQITKSQKTLEQVRKKLNLLNMVTFQDIQNAVFTLSGYLSIMKLDAPDKKMDQFLEKSEALSKKISETLNFAKNYQDMGMRPPRWQNVSHVFTTAISHLPPLDMSRTINVRNLEIFADPLLEFTFYSLVKNVLDHASGVTEISLRTEDNPGGITIIFEDNGPGIPAGRKMEIFEHDFGKNSGLGLLFCRETLSITGITIAETGEPGKGARFEISVPEGSYRFREP